MEISDLRREYTKGGFTEADALPDPIAQFKKWFDEAVAVEILEPNAMSLATCGSDGRPSVRTVLLKNLDERGFVFFTNYESHKARQLAENVHASALFPWLPLERQVIVTGPTERISTAESLKYFLSRPFSSQLGAWVSPQSKIISSRALLEEKLAQMKSRFANGEIPLPDHWGGIRILPETVEFWQGRPSRLHDRLEYFKNATGSWQIRRKAP